MASRFTVLASGSSGNAAVVDGTDGLILIDFGLGPRKLANALAAVRLNLADVRTVLLTHLHKDHWNEATLTHLAENGATLWCHAEHAEAFQESPGFCDWQHAGRVRRFEIGTPFPCGACEITAFGVAHDTFTCGFRIQDAHGALGFASDLGSWSDDTVRHLADVDVLALEFNHDVRMQETSRRSPFLIRRNLGRDGHLSNGQAARLLDAILSHSAPDRLQHLVLLHLSRQCNRPEFALAAAESVRRARRAGFRIQAAAPFEALPWMPLLRHPEIHSRPRPTRPRRRVLSPDACQPFFPGWD